MVLLEAAPAHPLEVLSEQSQIAEVVQLPRDQVQPRAERLRSILPRLSAYWLAESLQESYQKVGFARYHPDSYSLPTNAPWVSYFGHARFLSLRFVGVCLLALVRDMHLQEI